jgi:transposase
MRGKQYKVILTRSERASLSAITRKGNHPARQITRAHILLLLDRKPEGGKETILTDGEIAERCHCDEKLAYTVSKQYAQDGLDRVLTRKKRETPPVPAKATGEIEAKITAMACGCPPAGYGRWTLRLYEAHSKKFVGIQLSDTRIREVLKNSVKTASERLPVYSTGTKRRIRLPDGRRA